MVRIRRGPAVPSGPRPAEPVEPAKASQSRSDTHGLTDEQLRLVNRFPDQNPNPVLRMAEDGELIYANAASTPILDAVATRVGGQLPAELASRVRAAAADPGRPVIELEAGLQTFALLAIAAVDLGSSRSTARRSRPPSSWRGFPTSIRTRSSGSPWMAC